jgi:hypothetical protein
LNIFISQILINLDKGKTFESFKGLFCKILYENKGCFVFCKIILHTQKKIGMKVFNTMLQLFCFSFPLLLCGQAPGTDIYLYDISLINGRVNYYNPIRITDRAGYDNQPAFTIDSKSLLFSSDRDEGDQTDIYQYHLAKENIVRLTQTAESEYSPQPIPGKRYFSVVQVEADGETQRIWKFPLRKGGRAALLLPEVKTVGYYAWIDHLSLAAFLLPEPFALQTYYIDGRDGRMIQRSVGRSLHMIPNEYSLTYVSKEDTANWQIQKLGLITGETTPLVNCLKGEEDFCWSPEGFMLMGSEGRLYMCIPGKDKEWRFVGELGIGDFYRMAISPDGSKLAVVVYRE